MKLRASLMACAITSALVALPKFSVTTTNPW